MTHTAERHTGAAWICGAALWAGAVVVGLLGAADSDGAGFVVYELVWIVAHLALLGGLLGLSAMAPHGTRPLGRFGLGLAIVGRLVFLVGEVDSLRRGADDSMLLPIGAMLTAVGMSLFGVAVLRARRWTGWHRVAPLAVGLFPFVAMFPLAAAGGEPPLAAIGIWAVTFAALGVAARAEASAATASDSVAPRPTTALA